MRACKGDDAERRLKEAKGLHSYKLYAPQLRLDSISRTSIISRILAEESTRAALLQAPAGYSKSTTLRQIMCGYEDQGFPTAWLTFDEADNDPCRFLLHFRALIASARWTSVLSTVDEIDDGGRGYRSDWAIERLLRLGEPVALFLDDFQALENPAILTFFREFLDRVPRNARVFISSREFQRLRSTARRSLLNQGS